MGWQEYIEQRPDIMLGKPVVKGTRITVEHVLERLGAGWSESQLLDAYPHLKAEQIRAALTFASRAIASDETVFLVDITK